MNIVNKINPNFFSLGQGKWDMGQDFTAKCNEKG
jgi:hypothetical protein